MQSVLLVEDNPRTREALLKMLSTMAQQVEVAHDGLGGLNLARKHQFSMVITDHKMPLMDGLTLIRNLREMDNYADTPLVLLTTDELQSVQDRAQRVGADQ